LRRTVAEQLAERLFVIRNVMLFDQRDKVGRPEACQSGFREVRIRGIKILRAAMEISEIATASAGDQDLFACAIGALQDYDAPTARTGLNRAHQAGGSGA
jgi:hypothetical protein